MAGITFEEDQNLPRAPTQKNPSVNYLRKKFQIIERMGPGARAGDKEAALARKWCLFWWLPRGAGAAADRLHCEELTSCAAEQRLSL